MVFRPRPIMSFGATFWTTVIVGLHLCIGYDVLEWRHSGKLYVFARPLKEVISPLIFVGLVFATGSRLLHRIWARISGRPMPPPMRIDLPTTPLAALGWLSGMIVCFCCAIALVELLIIGLGGKPFFQQILSPLGWLAAVTVLFVYQALWLYLFAAAKRLIKRLWAALRPTRPRPVPDASVMVRPTPPSGAA